MKKLLLILALAGCSSTGIAPKSTSTPTAIAGRLPTGMNDTCNASRYHTLLAQDATALERILILGEVRIIRPSTIAAQDYRPSRMNFHVGPDGTVARISCG